MIKYEEIIKELFDYIDGCKAQPFSANKNIIVEKEVIDELLRELSLNAPDEIQKFQKIISNKDAILADAQAQADSIIQEANLETARLVSEHEIVTLAQQQAQELILQAQQQAQSIVDRAVSDANQIRAGAVGYADNQLASIQNLISGTIENTENRYNGFIKQMNDTLGIIIENRKQLQPEPEEDIEDITIDI
ncbi:MAG: hypothetical protein KBS79_02360 [Lachnospiraceae bacterium]|nr:hypothetical protein [Candidatus Minthocola equi]